MVHSPLASPSLLNWVNGGGVTTRVTPEKLHAQTNAREGTMYDKYVASPQQHDSPTNCLLSPEMKKKNGNDDDDDDDVMRIITATQAIFLSMTCIRKCNNSCYNKKKKQRE